MRPTTSMYDDHPQVGLAVTCLPVIWVFVTVGVIVGELAHTVTAKGVLLWACATGLSAAIALHKYFVHDRPRVFGSRQSSWSGVVPGMLACIAAMELTVGFAGIGTLKSATDEFSALTSLRTALAVTSCPAKDQQCLHDRVRVSTDPFVPFFAALRLDDEQEQARVLLLAEDRARALQKAVAGIKVTWPVACSMSVLCHSVRREWHEILVEDNHAATLLHQIQKVRTTLARTE